MELLIKKKLDFKVLEGLDKKIEHAVYDENTKQFRNYRVHEIEDLMRHKIFQYTHIVLPLTVSPEMVEEKWNKYCEENSVALAMNGMSAFEHFMNGFNWLSSLTKGETE